MVMAGMLIYHDGHGMECSTIAGLLSYRLQGKKKDMRGTHDAVKNVLCVRFPQGGMAGGARVDAALIFAMVRPTIKIGHVRIWLEMVGFTEVGVVQRCCPNLISGEGCPIFVEKGGAESLVRVDDQEDFPTPFAAPLAA